MPCPDMKLTVRRPVTAKAVAPPCAACPLRLGGHFLMAPDVQLARGEGRLIDLAAFGRRRDGIEHTAFGDARFRVLGHLLPLQVTRSPGYFGFTRGA